MTIFKKNNDVSGNISLNHKSLAILKFNGNNNIIKHDFIWIFIEIEFAINLLLMFKKMFELK